MTHHYEAERQHGSDWCIRDISLRHRPVCVTGLDQDEAETTANEWNTAEQKKIKESVEKT